MHHMPSTSGLHFQGSVRMKFSAPTEIYMCWFFLFHCAFDSHKLEVIIKPSDTYCVCKSQTEIIAHEIESSG